MIFDHSIGFKKLYIFEFECLSWKSNLESYLQHPWITKKSLCLQEFPTNQPSVRRFTWYLSQKKRKIYGHLSLKEEGKKDKGSSINNVTKSQDQWGKMGDPKKENGDLKLVHVVLYIILGRYFGMISRNFGMKIYLYLLF